MISRAATVDAFLKTLAPEERAVFSKIRALLLKAHPKMMENMRWRMPGYDIGTNGVGGFNKQKHYLCLYLNPEAVDPYRKELKAAGLDCGKSCIRFRKPELGPPADYRNPQASRARSIVFAATARARSAPARSTCST